MITLRSTVRLAAALLLAGGATAFAGKSFDAMRGNYPRHGSVRLERNGELTWSGDARIRFQSQRGAATGTLTLRGKIRGRGAERPYTNTIEFDEFGVALLSNVAPGVEDGYAADGTFTFRRRRIHAEFPIAIGTARGMVTVDVKVRTLHSGRIRIDVTQTLVMNTLVAPLVWEFHAARPKSSK